jgi:hypothetical protein
VLWGEDGCDVAFHDSEFLMIHLGAICRFGARRYGAGYGADVAVSATAS